MAERTQTQYRRRSHADARHTCPRCCADKDSNRRRLGPGPLSDGWPCLMDGIPPRLSGHDKLQQVLHVLRTGPESGRVGLDLALAPCAGSSDQQGCFGQVVSRDQLYQGSTWDTRSRTGTWVNRRPGACVATSACLPLCAYVVHGRRARGMSFWRDTVQLSETCKKAGDAGDAGKGSVDDLTATRPAKQ